MKSLIAILLASLFLLQSAGKLIIIANYEINKDYISKNLCENKAKPKSKCNGKCHLKKQLDKEDKKESQTPASQKEKSEMPFYSEIIVSPVSSFVIEKQVIFFSYIFSKSSKHLSGVFHPPQNIL